MTLAQARKARMSLVIGTHIVCGPTGVVRTFPTRHVSWEASTPS